MIALDTNILVRYFVGDDPEQSARAKALIEEQLNEDDPGLVSTVVIVELDWVLQSIYGVSAADVRAIIAKLLEARQLVIEHADAVEAAIAGANGDLADALIHETGRLNGCSHTITFDRKFARMEGVELLAQ
ncbi:MAG: PIN domain-containing protein [Sphingomonadaceae bacterium]